MRLIDADAIPYDYTNERGVPCTRQIDVDNVPTVEPMQWIPVAGRLPKKDGDYLVTTHNGQIARYIFVGGSSEEYWRRCATAWMPLPEPYKGESDGE